MEKLTHHSKGPFQRAIPNNLHFLLQSTNNSLANTKITCKSSLTIKQMLLGLMNSTKRRRDDGETDTPFERAIPKGHSKGPFQTIYISSFNLPITALLIPKSHVSLP